LRRLVGRACLSSRLSANERSERNQRTSVALGEVTFPLSPSPSSHSLPIASRNVNASRTNPLGSNTTGGGDQRRKSRERDKVCFRRLMRKRRRLMLHSERRPGPRQVSLWSPELAAERRAYGKSWLWVRSTFSSLSTSCDGFSSLSPRRLTFPCAGTLPSDALYVDLSSDLLCVLLPSFSPRRS
jgi:hypothetical protein